MAMQKLFSNMLLPVALNRHTHQAVENAIELANRLDCNLHILYTLRTQLFRSFFHSERKRKVSELQQQLSSRIKPGLLLQAIFTEGNPYEEVRNYVLSHDIDLVSVQRQAEPFWPIGYGFDPERLAVDTDCTVISDQGENGVWNCNKILLPVGSSVPINGVRVAVYLARQFNASMHLVTDTCDEENLASLQRTYHLLKDNTDISVECNTLDGANFHQSVLHYARSVHAGLIVANPAYRKQQGFFTRILGREHAVGKVAVVMVD
jgi:K+-sensing histidine kinase KdpD